MATPSTKGAGDARCCDTQVQSPPTRQTLREGQKLPRSEEVLWDLLFDLRFLALGRSPRLLLRAGATPLRLFAGKPRSKPSLSELFRHDAPD